MGKKLRTYVDSNVLIQAARTAKTDLAETCLALLEDDTREFVTSDWVKFETLPKAIHFRQDAEADFYRLFFQEANEYRSLALRHLNEAFNEVCASGVSFQDAVHIVIASEAECDELVTDEKDAASIYRTTRIKVKAIRPQPPI